jgi:hypothetical protein
MRHALYLRGVQCDEGRKIHVFLGTQRRERCSALLPIVHEARANCKHSVSHLEHLLTHGAKVTFAPPYGTYLMYNEKVPQK